MTSKQRAYLRSFCNTLSPILFIGKEGITENLLKNADEVLRSKELIKVSIQKEAPLETRATCQAICDATGAFPVQTIGNKFCIYRPNEENPVIVLP